MSSHTTEACRDVPTSGPSWAYTQGVALFAHRLTCVAMAFALSGSSAVLSLCMALCLNSPLAAVSATDAVQADHQSHGAVAEPAAVSPHAHHGTPASPQPSASVTNASLLPLSDARLVSSCDSCCVASPVALVAGPGVERADGKAFATAPAVSVASFQVVAAMQAAAPPSPSVPPPSPTRAPLALRI